jgi:hypothetical protein
MVEQVIKYSDGTETVIKYRGVIENGVFTSNEDIASAQEAPKKKRTVRSRLKDLIA